MNSHTRATEILHEALKIPASDRFGYITTVCAGDCSLRDEVTGLLRDSASADATPTDLMTPPPAPVLPVSRASAAASVASTRRPPVWLNPDDLTGHLIGCYELIRRVGKGGMGTVYAARRADQEFEKIVAVKLVRPGMESEEILRRFKHERQVLAGLDHPNIARLLDGGTELGIPYLVMEYVEGTAIDTWCKTKALSLEDKLRLFCVVASAVQYAHQSLVVHRDIKPANIMVANDGTPKLLDFGIAKVLNPDVAGQEAMTQMSQKPMTPEYASPEQIRGDAITTASDVYALGLLLYELITGIHPLREAYREFGIPQAVLDASPERPSEAMRTREKTDADTSPDFDDLARRLKGDLDAIVMMCLRKEPARRYASVQHLIDDVQRHLDGLPVRAHADSTSYRVSKFIRRHKTGVAAGAAVAAALLISTTVSSIYYHRANTERLRAEARFDDVRQFSTFVLFDLDKVLDQGITPARSALLEKATEYLGRLERDHGGNTSIERELVRGYLKIGDSKGGFYGPNLADREGARQNYRKALALLEKSRSPEPVLLAQTQVRLADLTSQERSPGDALDLYNKARKVLEPAVAAGNREARRALAETLPKIGAAQEQAGMPQQSAETYERTLTLVNAIMQSEGESPELRKLSATAEMRRGELWARLGRLEQGLAAIRSAIHTYQRLALESPHSPSAQRRVASSAAVLGDVLTEAGRHAEAAEAYLKALEVVEPLAASDPHNAQYSRDVSTFLGRLGEALGNAGQMAEAKVITGRLLDSLRPHTFGSEAKQFDLYQYSWTLLTTPVTSLRDGIEALRAAERLALLTQRRDPARLALLARAYTATGQSNRAVETAQEALRLVPAGQQSALRRELEQQLESYRARRASR